MPTATSWSSRLLLAGLLATQWGCASRRAISGQVLDRNGMPVERVIVSVEPGGVEIVTDTEGRFTIDYIREAGGERTDLDKKTEYRIEMFKPGYHISRSSVDYRRGAIELEPFTLVKDTIRVSDNEDDLDPEKYPDRTHSAGTNYEGE